MSGVEGMWSGGGYQVPPVQAGPLQVFEDEPATPCSAGKGDIG